MGKTCKNIVKYTADTKNALSIREIQVLRKNMKEKVRFTSLNEKRWDKYQKKLLTEERPQFIREEKSSGEITVKIELTLEEHKANKGKLSSRPRRPPELIKFGLQKLLTHDLLHVPANLRSKKTTRRMDHIRLWSAAYIISIFQKGDSRKCKNYRALSI